MGDGGKGVEDTDSGFQYVGKAIKANRRRRKGRDQDIKVDDGEKLLQRVEIVKAKMKFLSGGSPGDQISTLLDTALSNSTCSETIPTAMLMLGLGNVSTARASQMQLAFLLLVRDRLKEKREERIFITALDPIFNEDDRQILAYFDIDVSDENRQGKYSFEEVTFVYMPHCTKSIYENILRSNWTLEGLQRIWLCCNDLERYTHFCGQDRLTPCIDRIVPYLTVLHLPTFSAPNDTAFNDLAIQRFDKSSLASPDNLADMLQKVDLRPNERVNHPAVTEGSFWTLPEGPISSESDPELL